MTGSLAALQGVSSDLLRAINLNTIGYELDRVLAEYGLQLRQGDLYLNRLGAQRLNANVGDVVEIYIGPLPVRFRVRAIVDEAGPLSALMPVVMLRLSEAQQLLFMNDKVNAVLVSNVGDEMSGMQHTDAVSQRLRVLALDSVAVGTVADILRRSDVRTIVEREAASLPETSQIDVGAEGDVPPMLAGMIETHAAELSHRPDVQAGCGGHDGRRAGRRRRRTARGAGAAERARMAAEPAAAANVAQAFGQGGEQPQPV